MSYSFTVDLSHDIEEELAQLNGDTLTVAASSHVVAYVNGRVETRDLACNILEAVAGALRNID